MGPSRETHLAPVGETGMKGEAPDVSTAPQLGVEGESDPPSKVTCSSSGPSESGASSLPNDPGAQQKPLRSYYEDLLQYDGEGNLLKPKAPIFIKIRAADWFLTAVVAIGVMSDLIAYTIIVPVLPFRLQELGYDRVADRMSWLLVAYSAGILGFTLPVAVFFHRYPWRRGPLVVAVLGLEGSFLLFMFVNHYWAMILSRVLQGGCSTVVWTVGFALICENINPAHLGTHLGFAICGMSVGLTIAPPIGGALYQNLGWHAPFVFVLILCGVDTIVRLFILEGPEIAKIKARRAAWEEAVEAAKGGVTELEASDMPFDEKVAKFVVPKREKPIELPLWKVLLELCRLPRGVVAFMLVFVFGFIVGCLDATVAVHVESVWHKDSNFVGLIYLAASAPAFFGAPLAGHFADKKGSEWIILPAVVLCLPWLPLMTLQSSLPGFVICFAMVFLVVNVLNSIASLEMAIVSTFKPGISEIHEFAAMNLAFAISSLVGAIVGGQIYDGVSNGWTVVCWVGFALFVVAIPPPLIWTGKVPLWSRLRGTPPPRSGIPPAEREYWDKKRRGEDPEAVDAAVPEMEAKMETKDRSDNGSFAETKQA